jgi:hypothetical protein
MPYTVSCTPTPLTFTIRPRFDWQFLLSVAWLGFVGYEVFTGGWRIHSADVFDIVIFASVSVAFLLSLIRRERIEVYPDRMAWSKTYFGITRAKAALLTDILGAEWNEGEQQGRQSKTPDHVEFYLSTGSVKAGYGLTFDEFEKMRQEIGSMYPELLKRWGRATVRSKNLTLLNLS